VLEVGQRGEGPLAEVVRFGEVIGAEPVVVPAPLHRDVDFGHSSKP
jgi:hypothetical protein